MLPKMIMDILLKINTKFSSLAEPRIKICDPQLSYIIINMYVFGNIRPGKDFVDSD